MDSHDVSRGRGTMEEVLSHVEIPVCVLGIDSDVLYPLQEQEEIANGLPNGELKIIHSDAGHGKNYSLPFSYIFSCTATPLISSLLDCFLRWVLVGTGSSGCSY